jgi:O-glycosyl hydrolase
MDLVFSEEKGLGLNIVRYNIGGGENPAHRHFLRPGGDVPGFKATPDAPYDWGADANQRWVLLESINRGVTITEAFSNSPPWWMTVSGSVTGSGPWPAQNSLKDDSYGAFADYLTEVVREYRDRYGVIFDALSPLNEPDAPWWTFGGSQEGCRFTPDKQQVILKQVAEQLARKGLTTRLSAPEENGIDWTIATWKSYDEGTRDLVEQINTHSYHGAKREELRELARQAGKRLYMSEYGNGIDGEFGSALELARVIALDLNELQPLGWVYWQVVENADTPTDWGAIHATYSGSGEYAVRKQYWAYLHFTRHIRPGAVILEVGAPDLVAALNPGSGDLALVVTNREATERPLSFDLSAFPRLPQKAQGFRTTETENCAPTADIRVSGRALEVCLPPRSISTFVVRTGAPG